MEKLTKKMKIRTGIIMLLSLFFLQFLGNADATELRVSTDVNAALVEGEGDELIDIQEVPAMDRSDDPPEDEEGLTFTRILQLIVVILTAILNMVEDWKARVLIKKRKKELPNID